MARASKSPATPDIKKSDKAATTKDPRAGKRRIRPSKPDHVVKREFLELMAAGFKIDAIADRIGCAKKRLYDLRRNEPEFREAWDDALIASMDELVPIAVATASLAPRGVPGAATMLAMLLKARNPLVFCDRARLWAIQAKYEAEREAAMLKEARSSSATALVAALDALAAEKRGLALEHQPA